MDSAVVEQREPPAGIAVADATMLVANVALEMKR